MRFLRSFLALPIILLVATFVLLCTTSCIAPSNFKDSIEVELRRYYKDKAAVPNYKVHVINLSSPERSAQKLAVDYLVILFDCLRNDKKSGKSPYDETQVGANGYYRWYSDILTSEVIKSISASPLTDSELPLGKWLLENGNDTESMDLAIKIVSTNKSEESTDLVEKAISDLTNDPKILVEFAQELSKRKGKDAKPIIDPLTNHHRFQVRDNVRAMYSRLGWETTEFSESESHNQITKLIIEYARKLLFEPLPDPKTFKKLTQSHTQIENEITKHWNSEEYIWLKSISDKEILYLDIVGEKQKIDLTNEKNNKVMVSDYSLTEHANKLIKARAILEITESQRKSDVLVDGQNAKHLLFSEHLINDRFSLSEISRTEVHCAISLFDQGRIDLASKLLMPAFISQDTDKDSLSQILDRFGTKNNEDLLDVFMEHTPNYDHAIKLADHLSKPIYSGYRYHAQAIELGKQLRERRDKFASLKLPTEKEWAQFKDTMPKSKQIQYLAEHIRLLRAVPWYPDRFDLPFTGPGNSSVWSSIEGGTEIEINPYKELSQLAIEIDDIPHLLPYLNDDTFLLADAFWINFDTGTTLYRVRYLIGKIINKIALTDLVDAEKYAALSAEEQKDYKVKIIEWAHLHKRDSKANLLLDSARTTKDQLVYRESIKHLIQANDLTVLQAINRSKEFGEVVADDIANSLIESNEATLKKAGQDFMIYNLTRKTPEYFVLDNIVKLARAKDERVIDIVRNKLTTPSISLSEGTMLAAISLMDTDLSRKLATELLDNNQASYAPSRSSLITSWTQSATRIFWSSIALMKGSEEQRKRSLTNLNELAHSIEEVRWKDSLDKNNRRFLPYIVLRNIWPKETHQYFSQILNEGDKELRELICKISINATKRDYEQNRQLENPSLFIQACFLAGSSRGLEGALLSLDDNGEKYSISTTSEDGKAVEYAVLNKDHFAHELLLLKKEDFSPLQVHIKPPESLQFDEREPYRTIKDKKILEIKEWLVEEFKRIQLTGK